MCYNVDLFYCLKIFSYCIYSAVFCVISQDGGSGAERKVDGLSIHRLTLLGRVHVARVVVDSLSLEGNSAAVDVVPVRDVRQHSRGTRGKPPTPTRTVDRNKRCLDDWSLYC